MRPDAPSRWTDAVAFRLDVSALLSRWPDVFAQRDADGTRIPGVFPCKFGSVKEHVQRLLATYLVLLR
jgi:hypothetical protein